MREIGLAVAGVLILALALQSCRASHYSGQVEDLRTSLAVAKGQAAACATALEAVDAATAEAEAKAAQAERAGQQAAQAAMQAAREAEEREREDRRALGEARTDPDCQQVLEATICARVPLL